MDGVFKPFLLPFLHGFCVTFRTIVSQLMNDVFNIFLFHRSYRSRLWETGKFSMVHVRCTRGSGGKLGISKYLCFMKKSLVSPKVFSTSFLNLGNKQTLKYSFQSMDKKN